jgi:spermidine synthase
MNNLIGIRVLEEKLSIINGKVVVLKTAGLGTYIQVEGLTQSGSVVYDIWNTMIKKIKKEKPEVNDCLILGLGGGSAAKLVRKFWKKANIIGVDIDPVFVEFGKKYMQLDKARADIHVQDAISFIKVNKRKYDLILIDMYIGYEIPEKFTKPAFIKDIKKMLKTDGLAVFNRLYFDDKRKLTEEFGKKLEKEFETVERVYPEANVMFICS